MAFMTPDVQHFTGDLAREYNVLCSEDCFRRCDHEKPRAGWYSRLSAAGYLDCTDWSGPFETSEAALQYVCELYDVDANEDSTDSDSDSDSDSDATATSDAK
jgi:hypothetical protein